MVEFQIQEILIETIQGEGYWTGTVVDFVRLYGCPIACSWCDQEYAEGGNHLPRIKMSLESILQSLKSDRVVISGGEPFINKQLPVLVEALIKAKKEISIETSGVFYQPINPKTWVTLSPKTHLNLKNTVDDRLLNLVNEIKIVVTDGTELTYYREHLLQKSQCQLIYLQPNWIDLERTIPLTLNLLREFPIARLSLQTHKYIGVL